MWNNLALPQSNEATREENSEKFWDMVSEVREENESWNITRDYNEPEPATVTPPRWGNYILFWKKKIETNFEKNFENNFEKNVRKKSE